MNFILVISVLVSGFIFLNLVPETFAEPVLYDEGLILEIYSQEFFGWGYTTMTFVGEDILLLEKSGFVHLIRDGMKTRKSYP